MKISGTDLENLDDTTTQQEYKEVSSESRARNLAELQQENEELTPTTPTGTPDWYVKWFSMVGAVIGVFSLSAGFTMFGQLAYVLSSCGWVYVGMAWGDRAIMIGSAISGTAVMMNIVTGLTQ
jgi:hypothetical protein